MILRYAHLSKSPQVFLSMTGLPISEFDQLVVDVMPLLHSNHLQSLERPDRQRQIGGGNQFELDYANQILMTVVWLRIYPTNEVLGFLFGVSDSTVSRIVRRVRPVLALNGHDTLRFPDPGRKSRRKLDDLLRDTPELAVVIDSFEQKVQRPRTKTEADTYYSGKKKQHTLKSQIAVDEETGLIVDVSQSVVGPTPDIKLFQQSTLLERLPQGVGAIGDLGYVGIVSMHPNGRTKGACPRKKPRGKPRPEEDILYNTAFAKRRIIVEHIIGRLRHYQALNQSDRHHRQNHAERVEAVVGLVNRRIMTRLALAA